MFVKSIVIEPAVADTSVCSYFRAPLGSAEIWTVEPPPPPPPPVVAGVVEEGAALNLQSHPGQRNADTFLWLLSAWFLLALGAVLMAGALHIPSAAAQRSPQAPPQ